MLITKQNKNIIIFEVTNTSAKLIMDIADMLENFTYSRYRMIDITSKITLAYLFGLIQL